MARNMKPRSLALLLFLLLLSLLHLHAQEVDPTVYLTETGKRYHLDGCPYLERSKIPIALSEAVALGYRPCGACNPPMLPSTESPTTGKKAPARAPGLYRLNLAGVRSYREANLSRMLRAVVVRHIDGDTVYVNIPRPPAGLANYESVRLLGVDTPETVHRQKPGQIYGREASEFTRRRLLHRTVYLAFDWNLRDKYDRILAYVYLPDGSCHNADLLREGYAHAYTREPFQLLEQFRSLERYARERGKGLWSPRR